MARTDWSVYILECADGSFYTGITRNLEQRVAAHQNGRGARYTRTRRPVRVVYEEDQPSRSDALRREAAIKRLPRAGKRELIDARGDGD